MGEHATTRRRIGLAALLGAVAIVAVVATGRPSWIRSPVQGGEPSAAPPEGGLGPATLGAPARLRSDAVEGTAASPDVAGVPDDQNLAPKLDILRIGTRGEGVVAGSGAPGADIGLRLDGVEVATGQVDDAGNFVLLFDTPVSQAPQVLTLESRDAAGSVTRAPDSVIVVPTAPGSRTITPEPLIAGMKGPDAVGPDAANELSAPTQAPVGNSTRTRDATAGDMDLPAGTPPRLLRDGPDGLSPLSAATPDLRRDLGIDAITYDAAGEVALAGRGGPGHSVRIYLDNRPVALTRVGEDGLWSAPLPDVQTGVYVLRIDALDEEGAVAGRIETPFERTAPAIAAAARRDGATAITVQPGFTLWAISEGYFGAGIRYVQIFEANRSLIRDPNLIYPGQVFELPDPGD